MPEPFDLEDIDRADDGPPAPIPVEPIVRHMSTPILDRRLPPAPRSHAYVADGPQIDVVEAIRAVVLPPAVAGLIALLVVNGDWAMVVVWVTLASVAMRAVARRTTFNFADGFLAYRSRLDWPRGVQEDYDVAYRWPATGRFSGSRNP
jgi:hypothetical protein